MKDDWFDAKDVRTALLVYFGLDAVSSAFLLAAEDSGCLIRILGMVQVVAASVFWYAIHTRFPR